VQPYYYYRKIVVNPSTTKTRHSLPEVVTSHPAALHPQTCNRHHHYHPDNTHYYPHPTCNNNSNNNGSTAQYHHHVEDRIRHSSWRNRGGSIVEENYYEEICPPAVNPAFLNRNKVRREIEEEEDHRFPQRRNSSFTNPERDLNLSPRDFNRLFLQPGGILVESRKDEEQRGLIKEERRASESHKYTRGGQHHHHHHPHHHPHLLHQNQFLQFDIHKSSAEGDPESIAEQAEDEVDAMLTHQSRSLPSGPPIPGARLNRTYSISSQGHIESAVRKVRRYNIDFTF
jgi:hypothetical protein